MKKIFINIVLLLSGLLFAVTITEKLAGYYLKKSALGRKIVYFDSKSNSFSRERLSWIQFDQELGMSLKPGVQDILVRSDYTATYSINSQGIRDKEISLEKSNREFRILALGESTVFGEGVNYGDRLTEVVEQALKGAEVINMGVPGFGLDQSFLHLKRVGFKFSPNVGIIFIFSRDYLDRCMDITGRGGPAAKPRFILSDNRSDIILQDIDYTRKEFEKEFSTYGNNGLNANGLVNKECDTQSSKLIINNSKVLTLANYYLMKQKINEEIRQGDLKHFHSVFEFISWQDKRREQYKTEDFERMIFLLIKEYQKIFNEHNVDLVIVNMSNERLGFLEHDCKELNISYLDLSEVIINALKSEQLRFLIDTHYNSIYHRIVGENVSEYLRKKYNLKISNDFYYKYLGRFNLGGSSE